jgi:5S rRNA maturation endonuclease (ribonuclease M5)
MSEKTKELLNKLDIKNYYEGELTSIKWDSKGQGTAKCPFHSDTKPSLSVDSKKGLFNCYGCKAKGNIFEFYKKMHHVDYEKACDALSKMAGLTPQLPASNAGSSSKTASQLIACYDYKDESGKLIFQVVRYALKNFSQRRPDGNGGWINNLSGVITIPYNLQEVMKASTVFIVEGEKDVETLRSHGLVASCNPMGAGKWKQKYNGYLQGKEIIVLPDNDDPGKQHAINVKDNLTGIASSVHIVELPDLKEKEDITDWFNQGGTKEKLLDIISEKKQPALSNLILKPMKVLWLNELFAMPPQVVRWVVDEMLPSGGLSVLASKPKVGKSTLARYLALCIAKGLPFLDRQVIQGSVLYFAFEEKLEEVKIHFQDMGADGSEKIAIYAGMASTNALEQIKHDILIVKPKLVVIDTLFKLIRVVDANDYIQISYALEPLLQAARDTDAHILCVHHTNKNWKQDMDSILGSTAIYGGVDTSLLLRISKGKQRIISTSQRYGKDLDDTILAFDSMARTMSVLGKALRNVGKNLDDKILEFLSKQGHPVTEEEIIGNVRGSTSKKRTALRGLCSLDKVNKEGKGKKGSPYLYSFFQPLQLSSLQYKEPENDKHEIEAGFSNSKGKFSFMKQSNINKQENKNISRKNVVGVKRVIPDKPPESGNNLFFLSFGIRKSACGKI